MILCLVTERLRLCRGQTFDAGRQRLIEQARQAVDAGVDVIQVRERDLEARDLTIVVEALVAVSRGTATRVVVNDRLDVALASGADGVHLRSDSMAAADVRALAPAPFLIGRSVHSVDEATAAGAVDYLIAGTVFPTASKPAGHAVIGLDGLRAIAAATAVPVLAIGGVTLDRIEVLAGSGAGGVAAIGLFSGPEPVDAVVRAARSRFDSARAAS